MSRHHRDCEHGDEGNDCDFACHVDLHSKKPRLVTGAWTGGGALLLGGGVAGAGRPNPQCDRTGLVPMFGRQLAGFLPRQLLLAQNETGPFC